MARIRYLRAVIRSNILLELSLVRLDIELRVNKSISPISVQHAYYKG
jgi:hypothetical protein